MARYRFVSEWEFGAPVEAVWPEVGDPRAWKGYWSGLVDVRPHDPSAPPAPGASYDLVFKSFLPYTLTLTARIEESDEPHRLVIATSGELEGAAEYELEGTDGRTRTRLVWTASTTKPWMNALAFVLRGLFEWNHDVLMRRAGEGLASRIGAPVTHARGSAPPLARALLPPVAVLLCLFWLLRRTLRGGRRRLS